MVVVLFQAFQAQVFEIFGARCVETVLLLCDTLPKCAWAAILHMSMYWNFMWNTGADGTGEGHSTDVVALLVNVSNCHTTLFSKNHSCHTAIEHPDVFPLPRTCCAVACFDNSMHVLLNHAGFEPCCTFYLVPWKYQVFLVMLAHAQLRLCSSCWGTNVLRYPPD